MVEKSTIAHIKSYLKFLSANGIPEPSGILFGSRANGTSSKYSDIDLIVISSKYDTDRKWKDVDFLLNAAVNTCPLIEPILCGAKEWLEDDGRPILEIARREGIEVRID